MIVVRGPAMQTKKQGANEGELRCPNSSCGYVFSKPLKVKNVGSSDSQGYDACPRCLTPIIMEESVPAVDVQKDATVEDNKAEGAIVSGFEERTAEPPTAVRCAYHFGYLSERSKNEKIPDECMFCENIVKCMLKP